MRKTILCLMLVTGIMVAGCGVVKGVLKTVAITKKINAVSESETPIETLKALKELLDEVQE